jgi:hypothetical protein
LAFKVDRYVISIGFLAEAVQYPVMAVPALIVMYNIKHGRILMYEQSFHPCAIKDSQELQVNSFKNLDNSNKVKDKIIEQIKIFLKIQAKKAGTKKLT